MNAFFFFLIVSKRVLSSLPWRSESRDFKLRDKQRGFPGGAVVENLPANAGNTGSSPGLGRSHMPQSN